MSTAKNACHQTSWRRHIALSCPAEESGGGMQSSGCTVLTGPRCSRHHHVVPRLVQRKVRAHRTRPMTSHRPMTRAVRPCSHVEAISWVCQSSGKNTERMPCAIHLSGKREATCLSHSGRSVNAKYTPEMNWRISIGAMTRAPADRADVASEE